MSILETPRIYFKGQISWDPIVTNNYDQYYDETTAQTVFSAVVDKVKAFRQQAITSVATGNWNPHGTHRVQLYEAEISGVDTGSGLVSTDPFQRSAASLNGMLVDLEPYGAYSSQIYFDSMRFGVDGGYRILCPRTSRITARYINFARNPGNRMIAGVASVVWQTSFAKAEGLRIDAFDSPALNALASAVQADDVLGLTVRFNAYRTVYYNDLALTNGSPLTRQAIQELQDKLNTGGFQPNPARSVLVGTIGLWRRGEPAHEPGDRALLGPTGNPLTTVHARLGKASLTLDLSNSVPETDKALTKNNLGPLSIVALDAGGTATTLGTLTYAQYDRAAYEATAGIVTLPLTAAQVQLAAGSDLQLRNEAGSPLLVEAPLRAIPLAPNTYVDEGGNVTVSFQVYRRGAPATHAGDLEGVPVAVYTMSADGGTVETTTNLRTNAQGVVSLSFTASAGITAYVSDASPTPDPPSQGIDPQINTYAYVRALPADDDIAALPPTWENVYTRVLANWNAMAPCMDNWLRLDDSAQVKSYARVLKELTDPARFEAFIFMPVTRDMTKGARALLHAFLDAPSADGMRSAGAGEKVNFAMLGRAMRRA